MKPEDCTHPTIRTQLSDGHKTCLICGTEWELMDDGQYMELLPRG